jgi:two-component system sensor histidine kinase AlgZ
VSSTGTLRALLDPRRLAALSIMAVPLVLSQREAWAEPRLWPAVVIALVALVVFSTAAYRALLPAQWLAVRPSRGSIIVRYLAFTALSALAPMLLWGLPRLFGSEQMLVGTGWTAAVAAGLFWVGGFGLGRDIELEAGWRRESERAEALRRQAELAQLRALRAQVDPHFLFNTLNAIAEWCREDPRVAERALVDLSAILRDVLSATSRPRWTIRDERTLIARLFELHRLRDPGRFEVIEAIDPALDDVELPPLLCLPLAENAMTHGPGRGHSGSVRLEARREGDRAVLLLENPGPFRGRREGGEGIETVEARLAAWSPRARLTVEAVGDRTRAEVRL